MGGTPTRTYGATTTATAYTGATTAAAPATTYAEAPYTNAAAPAEEPVFLAEQQPALEGSRFRQMTSGFMQGATNIAERITGRDLDGDGGVGTSTNIAAAMQKRR